MNTVKSLEAKARTSIAVFARGVVEKPSPISSVTD